MALTSAPPGVTIVIVTHNRSRLLERLLTSVEEMDPLPAGVVVVDNAAIDETPDVLSRWRDRAAGFDKRVVRLEENAGGAGGFSAGVRTAFDEGATWLWLMDDDVEVLPDALARLEPWTRHFRCLTGRKWDTDGEPFRWQNRFVEWLGVPLALRGDPFGGRGWFEQTAGNFEGMLIHREVVGRIGVPDPRFFIVWDDAVYGWLASLETRCAVVDEFVLRRTRDIQQRTVRGLRLNSTGELYRFHVMRNRALVYFYLRDRGHLHRPGFAVGTAYTFGKELARLVLVQRTLRGSPTLLRGFVASRRLLRQHDWQPMPALEEVSR